ncbi:hypothetical protein KIPB_000508 [Kipferlia bialata]|uniref:Uncharacterized protein n=1 Tax=Kipferlia bialata TaxID=797122 RepID=A0A9K3CMM2_9EUKA|nr:hypothetical protein KIPB_000508 [Kipferlia bialata]|eukprot:g508.t1
MPRLIEQLEAHLTCIARLTKREKRVRPMMDRAQEMCDRLGGSVSPTSGGDAGRESTDSLDTVQRAGLRDNSEVLTGLCVRCLEAKQPKVVSAGVDLLMWVLNTNVLSYHPETHGSTPSGDALSHASNLVLHSTLNQILDALQTGVSKKLGLSGHTAALQAALQLIPLSLNLAPPIAQGRERGGERDDLSVLKAVRVVAAGLDPSKPSGLSEVSVSLLGQAVSLIVGMAHSYHQVSPVMASIAAAAVSLPMSQQETEAPSKASPSTPLPLPHLVPSIALDLLYDSLTCHSHRFGDSLRPVLGVIAAPLLTHIPSVFHRLRQGLTVKGGTVGMGTSSLLTHYIRCMRVLLELPLSYRHSCPREIAVVLTHLRSVLSCPVPTLQLVAALCIRCIFRGQGTLSDLVSLFDAHFLSLVPPTSPGDASSGPLIRALTKETAILMVSLLDELGTPSPSDPDVYDGQTEASEADLRERIETAVSVAGSLSLAQTPPGALVTERGLGRDAGPLMVCQIPAYLQGVESDESSSSEESEEGERETETGFGSEVLRERERVETQRVTHTTERERERALKEDTPTTESQDMDAVFQQGMARLTQVARHPFPSMDMGREGVWTEKDVPFSRFCLIETAGEGERERDGDRGTDQCSPSNICDGLVRCVSSLIALSDTAAQETVQHLTLLVLLDTLVRVSESVKGMAEDMGREREGEGETEGGGEREAEGEREGESDGSPTLSTFTSVCLSLSDVLLSASNGLLAACRDGRVALYPLYIAHNTASAVLSCLSLPASVHSDALGDIAVSAVQRMAGLVYVTTCRPRLSPSMCLKSLRASGALAPSSSSLDADAVPLLVSPTQLHTAGWGRGERETSTTGTGGRRDRERERERGVRADVAAQALGTVVSLCRVHCNQLDGAWQSVLAALLGGEVGLKDEWQRAGGVERERKSGPHPPLPHTYTTPHAAYTAIRAFHTDMPTLLSSKGMGMYVTALTALAQHDIRGHSVSPAPERYTQGGMSPGGRAVTQSSLVLSKIEALVTRLDRERLCGTVDVLTAFFTGGIQSLQGEVLRSVCTSATQVLGAILRAKQRTKTLNSSSNSVFGDESEEEAERETSTGRESSCGEDLSSLPDASILSPLLHPLTANTTKGERERERERDQGARAVSADICARALTSLVKLGLVSDGMETVAHALMCAAARTATGHPLSHIGGVPDVLSAVMGYKGGEGDDVAAVMGYKGGRHRRGMILQV